MIAGGASFAPSRWSLPALATVTRNSSGYLATARMTATQKTRNWAFSCGVSPGLSRLSPVSVDIEKLLCLPDPLIPANGFSCKRQTRPYSSAVRFITSMARWLWSVARFESSKIGAISYWLGATSLCRVLTGTPSLNSLASESAMHAITRSGIDPKYWSSISWPFGGCGAEDGPPAVDQVRPGVDEALVDQEVFLLRADGREHLLDVVVAEQLEDAHGLGRQGFHRPEQRRLLVEGLAGPRDEDGRDDEGRAVRGLADVGRAGRVPARVPAGLERGADAAGRERAGVRLALDQFLAAELGDRLARPGRLQEAVVLLGRRPGQRLEDVRVVGRAALDRPVLHGAGDGLGHGSGRGGRPA